MARVPRTTTSRPSHRRLEGILAALGGRNMQAAPRYPLLGEPRYSEMTSTTMISIVMSKLSTPRTPHLPSPPSDCTQGQQ